MAIGSGSSGRSGLSGMQISGRDRSELSGYGAVWQRAMAIFAVTSMHGLGGHLRHA